MATSLGLGTASPTGAAELTEQRLIRRIRMLVLVIIGYNLVEGTTSLLAGSEAGSRALLGFGIDSFIEVSSGLAVVWQLSRRDGGSADEARERLALRVIALCFFTLGVALTSESAASLAGGRAADPSAVGIVLAAASLVVMPVLSYLQRAAGRRLGSRTAVADSKQTLLCTYMSAVLLVGLLANWAAGWWWADSVAALAIALLALREGGHAWRGESCCAPAAATRPARAVGASSCGCGPGCVAC